MTDRHLDLTVLHASLQRTDSQEAQRADVRRLFSRRAHLIGLTEAGKAENKPAQGLLKAAAETYGYHFLPAPGYGEAIAIRNDLPILRKGFGLPKAVNGFKAGRPFVEGIGGQYPDRSAHWVVVQTAAGPVAYVVFHANASDQRPDRHATNVRIHQGVAALVKQLGAGNQVVFASADTNVDDAHDNGPHASTRPLRKAGLVSVWDQMGVYPNTHDTRTIDVIYRYRPDKRATLVWAYALKRGHSDHRGVVGQFRVRY